MSGMLRRLFGEGPGIKNVITLFHAPSSAASLRVHTLLRQAKQEAAAESHEFELEVTEADPTADQLRSILEFEGGEAAKVVEGAKDGSDAARKIGAFWRPVTVDWGNGKVVVGDEESAIIKMIKAKNS